MKFVLETLRLEEEREKLPVIKMEIDYELLTLYDALQENDTVQVIKSKERLKELRKQFLMIKKT
ncbi:hypothetical protein SAMN05216389_108102 [Oceanobacillus limi]|uniref:Uncharacterized protein n=1 Tax=Oceanobacillus limi TaxID=930131 RepID=A0A1I0DBM9_9BACI|nr:hypothetical protein [Oceanobacillus limi]SET29379.1 hypothetical protein SAMN05216389_108102 [Oceanobacillus limi]